MRGFSKYIRDFFQNRKGQLAAKGMGKSPLKKYYEGGHDSTIASAALAGGGVGIGSIIITDDDDDASARQKLNALANQKTKGGEYKHPDLHNLFKAGGDNINKKSIVTAIQEENKRIERRDKPHLTTAEEEAERRAESKGAPSAGAKGMDARGDGGRSKSSIDIAKRRQIDREVIESQLSKEDVQKQIDFFKDKFHTIQAEDGTLILGTAKDGGEPPSKDAQKKFAKAQATLKRRDLRRSRGHSVPNPTPSKNKATLGRMTKKEVAAVRRVIKKTTGLTKGEAIATDPVAGALLASQADNILKGLEAGRSEDEIANSLGVAHQQAFQQAGKREQAKSRKPKSVPQRDDGTTRDDVNKNLERTGTDADGNPTRTSLTDQEAEYNRKQDELNRTSQAVRMAEVLGKEKVKDLRDRMNHAFEGNPPSMSNKSKKWFIDQLMIKYGLSGQAQPEEGQDKSGQGGSPVKFDLKYLKEIFEFELKKETKREIAGASVGGALGTAAAIKRHRDWLLWKKLEEEAGKELIKPKDKTRRRMNLALHGGSAARVLGGALLGYGLTKVYNNRKKRKDERRRHNGSKA